MRAIVFGGSGFIGSHLVADLVQSGVDVTIADLVRPRRLPNGARYVRCDVREPIHIERAQPFDLVYNLAAVHRTPGHRAHEYYETNIRGAEHIIDWCEAGGEQSICFTSSISVYGASERPKDETADPPPNTDYGRSKLSAERVHRRWQQSGAGRRLTIVRPAAVFGPGEGGNFTRLADALRRGRFMYAGRTDVVKSCGYVGDLVEAIKFAEELHEPTVTFNFCYEERYTIAQICAAFYEVAGYALPRRLPDPVLQTAMSLLRRVNPNDRGTLSSARIAKLTASTNIVPAVLAERGFTWPTDITDGLRSWHDMAGRFA